MPQKHPDRGSLHHFVEGKLDRRQNLKLAWHLLNCGGCRRLAAESERGRRLVAELFEGLLPMAGNAHHEYDAAISRAYEFLLSREAELERERSRAPELCGELAGHPPGRQRVLIHNTRRFQSWSLVEYLLARCAEAWLESPADAQDLADLALTVAERLPPESYTEALVQDLKSRCWIHVANSRRVVADLPGAEEAFRQAERHLARGTGDPVEGARLRHVKASLRRDQRRFEEAEGLLRRAASAYRRVGERHELGKALFSLSLVHRHQGDPGRALERLKEAVELIDSRRDPHLALGARFNLIDYLAEAGRFMEAQALLGKNRQLFQQGADPHLQRRLPWVKGKIALGLGQLEQAAAAYRTARHGFQEQGAGVDAALVGLELAMVCARLGQTAEVKELAFETLSTFQALDVSREALAAALVLQRAAAAERVSVELLQEVAGRIRDSLEGPKPRQARRPHA